MNSAFKTSVLSAALAASIGLIGCDRPAVRPSIENRKKEVTTFFGDGVYNQELYNNLRTNLEESAYAGNGALVQFEIHGFRYATFLRQNQTIVYSPSRGYSILTDEENDGRFECEERTYFGRGGARGPVIFQRKKIDEKSKEGKDPIEIQEMIYVNQRLDRLNSLWDGPPVPRE